MIDLNLQRFAGDCLEAAETAQETTEAMFMTEAPGGAIAVCELPMGAPEKEVTRIGNELFPGKTYAALVSRVNWSPDAGPSSPGWCVTAVSSSVSPAVVAVHRHEDAGIWNIPVDEAPWFALATAAGLRRALKGKSLVPKLVPKGDRRLLNRPGEGPPPPTDEHGLI